MRLFKPWIFASCLYPKAVFRVKTTDKILCLTFDDGPDPASTFTLLTILEKYNITALFFCNGNTALKYPDLINQIKSKGHIIGNHGFDHLDGLSTPTKKYMEDVALASPLTSGKLFRPPFGRLRLAQYRKIVKSYRLILWDIMPYDFDRNFGKERSLAILKKNIRPGSIVVLHDKSSGTVLDLIEEFLEFTKAAGYRFDLSGCLPEQLF